jgi:hypothetical protein
MPKPNPAKTALTKAVNDAIAKGAPVYVNQPAPYIPQPGELFSEPEPEAPAMDAFSAAMIADGEFDLTPFEATEENYLAAYQYLVDTGMAWTLQGRIGRTAADLISNGQIVAKE